MVAEQQTTEVLRRNETNETINGKLVEFAWWMKKEGYRDATILGRSKLLRILTRREADLYDPESVKKAIAKQPWCEGRKGNAVDAYSTFLKDGWWNMDSSEIHSYTKTAFCSQRNRNRPASRSMQPPNRNIPSTAQRNRHKMRRSMATQMGRHGPGNQHSKHNSREE